MNTYVVQLRRHGAMLGTRALGSEAAEEIRASDPAVEVMLLDFTDVRVASSPFLDEIVCAARSAITDHPNRYVLYAGLNDDVSDTLRLVAERRGIVLAVLQAERLRVVGGRSHLEETLAVAQEMGTFTASELADRLELKLPNLHQRLLQLQAAGAVTRAEHPTASRGGRLLFGTPDVRELSKAL